MSDIDIIKLQVGCNNPATEAQIKISNLKLRQNNLPLIPSEYADLLQICNGFSNEDARVFGVEIQNNTWYTDIADFNISYFKKGGADWLILGESDFSFFVYDSSQKKYALIDRDTLKEEYSDSDFMPALCDILRIE